MASYTPDDTEGMEGMGLLIPIYKKWNRMECEDYQGICLLNRSYNIWAEILFSSLTQYAEELVTAKVVLR